MLEKIKGTPGGGINFHYIFQILGALGVLYIFSVIFSYIQQYIMAGVAQKTVYALRNDVNAKLARLPIKFYDTHKHGDILSRSVNDLDNIGNALQQSLAQLVTSAVTLIGVVVMMLTISPLMTVIVLVTLPLSFIVTKKIAVHSQRYFLGQQQALGQLNSHVEEMYSGHEVVKAFGYKKQFVEKFNKVNDQLYDSGWRAQFISGIMMPLISFINNIVYVFICVIGSILVTKRAIQVGDIQAFIQYIRQFSQPIHQGRQHSEYDSIHNCFG